MINLSSSDYYENIPNFARLYNYLLGDYHNLNLERHLGYKLSKTYPQICSILQVYRLFQERGVEYLINQGIDQFIDIGCGIPDPGSVHKITDSLNIPYKVVYVDNDPVVIDHCYSQLYSNQNTLEILADLNDPDQIFENSSVLDFLNLSKPVGLIFINVFEYVHNDSDLRVLLNRYKKLLPLGSFIMINHITDYRYCSGDDKQLQAIINCFKELGIKIKPRSAGFIEELFADLEIISPGIVHPSIWKPDLYDDLLVENPGDCLSLCGIGKKIRE